MEFDIKCEDEDNCSSDLDTRVQMRLIGGRAGSKAFPLTNETAIYLDFANELQVSMSYLRLTWTTSHETRQS